MQIQTSGFPIRGKGYQNEELKKLTKASPQFSVLSYEISKYAGFLPVTNELLDDSDENITSVLTEWISDEARVTDNTNILSVIKKKTAVVLGAWTTSARL